MNAVAPTASLDALIQVCEGVVLIQSDWAPNPPPEHGSSKLVKYTFLDQSMSAAAVYWLWRGNGAPHKWQLVPPTHWAPLNAMKEWPTSFHEDQNQSTFLEFLRIALAEEVTSNS